MASRAEGFFLLDLLFLFYQEKRNSPRGNERRKVFDKDRDILKGYRTDIAASFAPNLARVCSAGNVGGVLVTFLLYRPKMTLQFN
jgi:hypothetical protein